MAAGAFKGYLMFNNNKWRGLALGAAGLALTACQTSDVMQSPIVTQPELAPVTIQSNSLRTLPPPSHRVIVAVYDFPDLTGQFKERDTVQTLSKAVTQGGASMLIKALQDAGERRWFTVLDRAELDDLLKERQIVTEMRRIYRNEERVNANALAPLRHAGIILQGGIIGYDTNTLTGGLGARYLGIGADTKWQQDTITVTLRAVSTNTGEVLSSVTVHKMVASAALQGGAFRYIMLDKILEAEAGITQNEPKELAVQEAIEKAVESLIIEGADLGIWSFQDRSRGQEIIKDYLDEKYGRKLTVAAQTAPGPDTANPTQVVETTPYRPATRPRRAAQPAAPAPARTPPPAAKDETVGSIRHVGPKVATEKALPPAPSQNEVVGSVETGPANGKGPRAGNVKAIAVAMR